MLSASMTLLGYQSVDNVPGSSVRSVTQVACYVSTMFGILELVVVQILLQRHEQDTFTGRARGAEFLDRYDNNSRALERSAISFR